MWTCVEPFWYNRITIFGRLCGQLPDTAKWLPSAYSHKPHQILTNALRIRLVSIYGNGAGGVRVQHMSPYNTCELDAPSPHFAGLMHSCQPIAYVLHIKLMCIHGKQALCLIVLIHGLCVCMLCSNNSFVHIYM